MISYSDECFNYIHYITIYRGRNLRTYNFGMVNFVRLDHSFNQVIENRGFALRPVEAITAFIQVPLYMLFAYP